MNRWLISAAASAALACLIHANSPDVFAQEKSAATTGPGSTSAAGAAAADSSFDPALADRGKRTYTNNCARCHGLNMISTGAGFFDLRQFPANERSRFFDSVKNGKRAMPAWRDSLKEDEIESIWSYVVTAKPKTKG